MSVLEQTARMAPREAGMAPSVAQQFAALGLTCTTVEEAAQAIEALSALARTEAAAKAGAIVECDALRALIAEVVATKTSVRDVTYGHTVRRIPHELMDRLVAATRTTEGQ